MRVLFVCTGNVFRSLTAEYCLKNYLDSNNILGIIPGSAGISAEQQPSHLVLWELLKKGIDARHHVPEQLNKRHLLRNELIIAMGRDHRDFLKTNYNVDAPLFNQLSHGLNAGVLDVHEAIVDYKHNKKAAENHVKKIISHIDRSMPLLVDNIKLGAIYK